MKITNVLVVFLQQMQKLHCLFVTFFFIWLGVDQRQMNMAVVLIALYHGVNVNLAKFITAMNFNDNILADRIIISNVFLFSCTLTSLTSPKEWKCPVNLKWTRSRGLIFHLAFETGTNCHVIIGGTNSQGLVGVRIPEASRTHRMTLTFGCDSLKSTI